MPLLINGIILIIFGLLAVYSVSIYESFQLSLARAETTNYYYFKQQVSALVYIAIAVFLVWKFPLKILKSHTFATIALIAAFTLQCLVFSPLGDGVGGKGLNGARGWIFIPGLPSIQPSEVFKLAYIFFLSSWLIRKKDIMQTSQFLISFIVMSAVSYAVFLFIPDFGTILIIGATALIMVRYAGLSIKKTLTVLVIGLVAGALAGLSAGAINQKYNYIQKRFAYFFTMDSAKRAEEKEKT
jgi:cell division protein FtsW